MNISGPRRTNTRGSVELRLERALLLVPLLNLLLRLYVGVGVRVGVEVEVEGEGEG